jgi:hypothetical protein
MEGLVMGLRARANFVVRGGGLVPVVAIGLRKGKRALRRVLLRFRNARAATITGY